MLRAFWALVLIAVAALVVACAYTFGETAGYQAGYQDGQLYSHRPTVNGRALRINFDDRR